MPYFLILPVWLLILLIAGGLAFMKSTRRLAAYIAVCSTSGVLVSIVLSTLALILVAKLPWSASGSTAGGIAFLASYIGGIALGGVLGVALGFWGLYRFTGSRKRLSGQESLRTLR
jgi:hypothetical protein